jgi:prefoldin alpha subunit
MIKEELQQRYMEFQLMSRQINLLNQQTQMITSKIEELRVLSESLAEINNLKKGQEILIPVGAGILMKASLNETKEILMNVGAEVVVKKTSEESQKIIESQINELESALSESEQELVELTSMIESIQKDLSSSNE